MWPSDLPNKRGAIISRGEDAITGNSSWTLLVAQSGFFEVMLEDANDDNQILSSGTFVADDTWHHVAASRSAAGAMTLYVDGLVAAQFSGTNVPSSNNQRNLSIGCTYGVIGPPPPPPPPAWFFKGRIDQPAMWDLVLSDDEVRTVALRGVDPPPSGLVGYWPPEEGPGQAVAAMSSAGHDGGVGAKGGVNENRADGAKGVRLRSSESRAVGGAQMAGCEAVDRGGDEAAGQGALAGLPGGRPASPRQPSAGVRPAFGRPRKYFFGFPVFLWEYMGAKVDAPPPMLPGEKCCFRRDRIPYFFLEKRHPGT